MKRILLLVFAFQLTACDPAAFQKILDDAATSSVLSQTDIANGLKEALNQGVDNGVQYLAKTDGFYKTPYKILLPEEAQTVVNKLSTLVPGFGKVEEVMIEKINRAAEDAVKKATPIFVGAIRKMTFDDVMNILMGQNNAATKYLDQKTFNPLYKEFNPVIVTSLNKFGALDYWADAVKAYNKIPLIKKMNPDLDDYITQKSLEALFSRIEIEEKDIRANIGSRSTELMRRVFAKQD